MVFDLGEGIKGYVLGIYPDDSPAIDFVLDSAAVGKIYTAWNEKEHGELVDFGGGVRVITAKMVSDVGVKFLVGIKGIGQKRAGMIMQSVHDAENEVPHG